MKDKNSKNIFSRIGAWIKERVRKFFVALKKNPQAIPLVALCAAFLHYSLNLTYISKATDHIYGPNMGLASFLAMLFMILSFVCMLSAFPKRQKPKVMLIIVMMVLYISVIVADVHYLNCITEATTRSQGAIAMTTYIAQAGNTVIVNIALMAVTIVCVLLEPVFAKLVKKINTSIDVEGQSIEAIDISDEE